MEAEIKPPRVATMPPIERGIIIPERAGTERITEDVASAPATANPVVLYTLNRNWLTPTFWETVWLVVRESREDEVVFLGVEKK